jgi:hypothetical protein
MQLQTKVGADHLGLAQSLVSSKYFFEIFLFSIIFSSQSKMTSSTKLDEKLEGANNFQAWKYRVMLILEENDLEGFVKEEVPKPEEYVAKAKYKKNLVKAKRIIRRLS